MTMTTMTMTIGRGRGLNAANFFMVLWTTFFSLQFQGNFLVCAKNLPGSGSGLRFLAGSGSRFNEYGSKTLVYVGAGSPEVCTQ